MMSVKVPPIKIQGIKTKLTPFILDSIKEFKFSVWVEPFMGSGVVGFNAKPCKAIFADINPHIINFYNSIKEGKITPKVACEFLHTEGEKLEKFDDLYYYEVRQRFNGYHNSLDFLFLNRSCFNGMIRFNKKGEFNVPYGHKPQRFSKAYITKICNQIKYVCECLGYFDWEFKCQSFEKTITQSPSSSLIYCDPPYIGRHVDYFDSWDIDLENKLHDLLQKTDNNFIISTWDHNHFRKNHHIDTVWKDYNKLTTEHFYFVGAKEINRNPVTEALLSNCVFEQLSTRLTSGI
nr:Dam family site-specific DNA-(adenine-N6)-methyltransferase [Campylobacter sp.]